MSETISVSMKFDATGTAPAVLRDMAERAARMSSGMSVRLDATGSAPAVMRDLEERRARLSSHGDANFGSGMPAAGYAGRFPEPPRPSGMPAAGYAGRFPGAPGAPPGLPVPTDADRADWMAGGKAAKMGLGAAGDVPTSTPYPIGGAGPAADRRECPCPDFRPLIAGLNEAAKAALGFARAAGAGIPAGGTVAAEHEEGNPFAGLGGGPRRKREESGGGFGLRALLPIGAAFGAMHLAAGGMSTAANLTNIANNSDMNTFQKNRATAESLPIVGTLAKSFFELKDAASGVTEALRKQGVELEHQRAMHQIEASERNQLAGLAVPEWQAEARREAVREVKFNVRPAPLDTMDPRQREKFERLLPVDRAELEARRGIEEQRGMHRVLTERSMQLHDEAVRKKGAADRAGKNVAFQEAEGRRGENNKVELGRALNEQELALNQLIQSRQERMAVIQERMKAAVGIAEQQRALGMAQVQQDQVRLGLLQQQEQRMSAQAQALGMMDEGQRALAESAFDRLKESGWKNLVAEEKQRVQQFAPEFAKRQAIEEGEGLDLTHKIRQLTGDRGRVVDVQKQIMDLQQVIEVRINFDKEGFAKQVAKEFAGQTKMLEDLVRAIHEAEAQKVNLNEIRARNFPGGR